MTGNLILKGSGDPTLTDAAFDILVAKFAATGITKVKGQLIADDSAFGQTQLGTGWACDDVYVKRSAAEGLTPREQRRGDLTVKILEVHADSDGTYGSPRVTAALRGHGEVVSEKTVATIMAGIGIAGISPRTFKVRTTVVDPDASFPPDQVPRYFDQGRLDAVWMTDIRYLTCGEGDMFLYAIRDGHSRRVLGHVVADDIGGDMVCEAIDAAVMSRWQEARDVAGTIRHSDRGGEFTASLTAQACGRHDLKSSMGDTGICWDNAGAESFWSTFKHEYNYRPHVRHEDGTRCRS